MISELKASQAEHVTSYGPFLDKELSKTQAVGFENHIRIESLRLGLLACLPSMLVSQHRGFYDIRNLELRTQKPIGKFRGNFKIESQADSPRSSTVTSYYTCSYGCPILLFSFFLLLLLPKLRIRTNVLYTGLAIILPHLPNT